MRHHRRILHIRLLWSPTDRPRRGVHAVHGVACDRHHVTAAQRGGSRDRPHLIYVLVVVCLQLGHLACRAGIPRRDRHASPPRQNQQSLVSHCSLSHHQPADTAQSGDRPIAQPHLQLLCAPHARQVEHPSCLLLPRHLLARDCWPVLWAPRGKSFARAVYVRTLRLMSQYKNRSYAEIDEMFRRGSSRGTKLRCRRSWMRTGVLRTEVSLRVCSCPRPWMHRSSIAVLWHRGTTRVTRCPKRGARSHQTL